MAKYGMYVFNQHFFSIHKKPVCGAFLRMVSKYSNEVDKFPPIMVRWDGKDHELKNYKWLCNDLYETHTDWNRIYSVSKDNLDNISEDTLNYFRAHVNVLLIRFEIYFGIDEKSLV